MMLAILIATYLGALALDFRPSLKECAAGEKALYLALMAIGFSVLVLDELGVKIPSPATPIEDALRALLGIS